VALKLSFRLFSFIVFIIILIFLIFQALLQNQPQFQPNPSSYLEHIILVLLGLNCLIASLFVEQSVTRKIFCILSVIICLAGLYVSGLHAWIQNMAPTQMAHLSQLTSTQVTHLNFTKMINFGIHGSTASAQIVGTWLFLSLAEWAFILFLVIGGLYGWLFMKRGGT